MRRLVHTFVLCQVATAAFACSDTEAAPDRSASRTFEDALGRPVTLEAAPSRIVSLVPSATALVVEMGAADRLAGRTRYDTASALRDLPSVGEPLTPSLEVLVELEPDLVLAWGDLRPRGLERTLGELGIPVYFARVSGLEDLWGTLADLGALLGRRAAADSLQRRLRCELAVVRTSVAGRPPRTTAFLVWPDPPTAAGPGSYIDALLEAAGGHNVFGGEGPRWLDIGLETLVARNPEVLVLSGDAVTPAGLAELLGRPGWRSMRAVREGRVFRASDALFHRPGPRLGEAARTLAGFLHPEEDVAAPTRCP